MPAYRSPHFWRNESFSRLVLAAVGLGALGGGTKQATKEHYFVQPRGRTRGGRRRLSKDEVTGDSYICLKNGVP